MCFFVRLAALAASDIPATARGGAVVLDTGGASLFSFTDTLQRASSFLATAEFLLQINQLASAEGSSGDLTASQQLATSILRLR